MNFDDVAKRNVKEHNPNWPQFPDRDREIEMTHTLIVLKLIKIF